MDREREKGKEYRERKRREEYQGGNQNKKGRSGHKVDGGFFFSIVRIGDQAPRIRLSVLKWERKGNLLGRAVRGQGS